jgi:hypothetical protein
MKKLAIISCFLLVMFLAGCDAGSSDCLARMVELFGSDNVQQVDNYKFIVKEGDIYYFVETMNSTNSDITRKIRICLDQ